jgi:hypothetical protein
MTADFHMPAGWYEPPAEHECDDPDCDGEACETTAREAFEDAQIERADARRKGDEYA